MEEPGFQKGYLSSSRVVIWGLGLMGGSLALALRGKCAWMVGIDLDHKTIDYALDQQMIDQGSTHPAEVLDQADIIILATPVNHILSILDGLANACRRGALVMDLGSTKREIIQKMEALPDRFDSIGAHPMCGKEKGTIYHADAAIYQGAAFALVAHSRTSLKVRSLGEEIVKIVGSEALWIDADTHDRWVAATSHVPFLLASALAQATSEDVAPLVGPGFRSTARLAGSSAKMMVDILETNADHVKAILVQFRTVLDRYEKLLDEKQYSILEKDFAAGAEHYRSLIKEKQL